MKKYLITLYFLTLLPSAFAQQAVVLPGSKPGTTSGVVSFSSGDQFLTRVLKDRSVFCRYRGPAGVDVAISPTLTCPVGTCPTARLIGEAEGGIDQTIGSDDAISFIAEANDDGFLPEDNRYNVTFTGVSPSPSNIIIECFNTTLFGNFNTVTVANPFNFLEISNDSNVTVNVRVVVTKNDGTLLSKTNLSIDKDQQKDIAIHDIAGAANTFGRVTVAHDGPLHGVRAKITKYTSSFLITASDKFETRGNED